MKLYSSDLSNFSSKTRIAIREKGLNIELVKPPGGASSAEYRWARVQERPSIRQTLGEQQAALAVMMKK